MQEALKSPDDRAALAARARDAEAHAGLMAELSERGPAMIRVACVLAFAAFVSFAFVDPWLVRDAALRDALTVRIASCGLLAGIFALTFARDFTRRHARVLSHAACLVTGLTVIVLAHLTGGADSDYHEALLISMFGFAILPVPWRRWDALVIFSGFVITYLALIAGVGRVTAWGPFVTHAATISLAAVVAVVLQQIVSRARLREFVQRAELAQANERLKALDEAKSRFFANLSHELRTPLTLTLAPLEALLESSRSPLSEGQRERLMLAQRNTLRLLRLVDDLLALTRAESAALHLDVAPLDLGIMVSSLVEDIGGLAARKHLEIETRLEPAPLVEADAHLVERVMLNLVGNAAKFVAEGGRIGLEVRPAGDGAELIVSDNGIGIAEADLPRIFDRFFQVDASSTRRSGGTGIGLALVREIMELHGGHVRAQSTLGVGTTLTCWFPRTLPPERVANVRRRQDATSKAGLPEWHEAIRRDRSYRLQGIDDATERRVAPRPEPRGPAPTVLVVEDNHDMIRFLVALLAYDFNVLTAQNGRDGLRMAVERRPDLIISDVMMPELDGVELVQALRASPATRHIPFIFLTARGEVDDRLVGRKSGADAYLTKPFKSEELLAAVDSLLSRQSHIRRQMSAREDELVVFMASGVFERLDLAVAALDAARDVVARAATGITASRFEASLQRLQSLAQDLDGLVHAGVGDVGEGADVETALRRLAEDARRDGGATLAVDIEPTGRAALPAQELEAVLGALLSRALAVTPEGHVVHVVARVEAGAVVVRIEDGGPALAADHLERIFFPFYDGGGADPDGVGLARARRTVLARDGRLTVEQLTPVGTRVVVHLPRLAA